MKPKILHQLMARVSADVKRVQNMRNVKTSFPLSLLSEILFNNFFIYLDRNL